MVAIIRDPTYPQYCLILSEFRAGAMLLNPVDDAVRHRVVMKLPLYQVCRPLPQCVSVTVNAGSDELMSAFVSPRWGVEGIAKKGLITLQIMAGNDCN